MSGPRGGPADGGEVSGVVSGSNQGGAQVLVPHAHGPVTTADKHFGVERASCQAIHWPMVPWKPHQFGQFSLVAWLSNAISILYIIALSGGIGTHRSVLFLIHWTNVLKSWHAQSLAKIL